MDQLARFRTNLATIADCYAAIAVQHRAEVRDERMKPDHWHTHREKGPNGGTVICYGKPTGTDTVADPVAHAMPSGPTKQASTAPRVGGSHEAPVPVSLDLVDITGPANADSLLVADLSPWPEDQIGDPAIASELHLWVHDIASMMGEREPLPTVPVMAMWLREYSGWAWDYYAAVDEMVVVVDRIARRLYAIVNPRAPRPEQKAAPCPGCGEATLLGADERVWCTVEDCGRVLTEGEYVEWARSVIVRETMGGEAMTAAAIAIQYGRTKENIHWLAHKHGWKRSDGKHRPVLYLATDVAATMATLRTRRPAQLDTDRISKG